MSVMERIIRGIHRRTRVVGALHNGHSALMLCAPKLPNVAGTRWGMKRYLNTDLLREQDLDKVLELAEAI
jgi:hypothetical protein